MDDIRKRLGEKTIAELRKEAVQVYGISISRDHNKKDLIDLICQKETGDVLYVRENVRDDNGVSASGLESGMSRVTISNSSAQNDFVCRVNDNGFQVSIPFDVEVDIPTRTADYLKGLKVQKLVKSDNGEFLLEKHVEWVPKYGVTFHERREGPCKHDNKYLHKKREALLRPKREFYAKHGFWPSDKKLRDPAYKD